MLRLAPLLASLLTRDLGAALRRLRRSALVWALAGLFALAAYAAGLIAAGLALATVVAPAVAALAVLGGGAYVADAHLPALLAEDLPRAEAVLVVKSERRLHLLRDGVPYRSYAVALGGNPAGHKQQEGDQRTPAITALRRMGLATAWRAPDGGLNGVWVQAVGRDGRANGAPEMANTTIPGNQFDPAVSRVGTTRNYFVVWTASGTAPGDGTNIILRRFMGP